MMKTPKKKALQALLIRSSAFGFSAKPLKILISCFPYESVLKTTTSITCCFDVS